MQSACNQPCVRVLRRHVVTKLGQAQPSESILKRRIAEVTFSPILPARLWEIEISEELLAVYNTRPARILMTRLHLPQ